MSICVRAGLSKPRPVPDTERIKDTKTLDYASTPLDANTVLPAGFRISYKTKLQLHQVFLNHLSRLCQENQNLLQLVFHRNMF